MTVTVKIERGPPPLHRQLQAEARAVDRDVLRLAVAEAERATRAAGVMAMQLEAERQATDALRSELAQVRIAHAERLSAVAARMATAFDALSTFVRWTEVPASLRGSGWHATILADNGAARLELIQAFEALVDQPKDRRA